MIYTDKYNDQQRLFLLHVLLFIDRLLYRR